MIKKYKIYYILLIILLIIIGIVCVNRIYENSSIIAKNDKQKLSEMEFSYRLANYKDNKFKISITVEDKANGMDIIEFPNGTILQCNGKKKVGLDYEIEEGTDYIFIVRDIQGNEKREVVNFTKPEEPTITTPTIETPTLSLKGIDIPKVEIKYDERPEFEGYYSIDNGKTWNLYTEPVNATSYKIIAKSVHKKCPTLYTEVSANIQQTLTSLNPAGYDGNMDTYADYNVWPNYSCKFYIDDTCWDKYISLHFRLYDFTTGYYRRQQIVFKDENNQIIDTYTSPDVQTGIVNNIMAKIPKNTKSVSISSDLYLSIYEVSLKLMTPEITYSGYPKLTDTGFINEKNVAIKYDDSDSIENYYSEDDGNTWKKYSKDFFTTANKIMAKSIMKEYNIESYISTKELKDPADTIGKEAYDGNLDSYCLSFPTIRFDIDESVWNKNINMKLSVNYWSSFKREIYITFMNENNEEISKTRLGALNSWSTNLGIYTVEVPNGSKYATITMSHTPLELKIYEIYK